MLKALLWNIKEVKITQSVNVQILVEIQESVDFSGRIDMQSSSIKIPEWKKR